MYLNSLKHKSTLYKDAQCFEEKQNLKKTNLFTLKNKHFQLSYITVIPFLYGSVEIVFHCFVYFPYI